MCYLKKKKKDLNEKAEWMKLISAFVGTPVVLARWSVLLSRFFQGDFLRCGGSGRARGRGSRCSALREIFCRGLGSVRDHPCAAVWKPLARSEDILLLPRGGALYYLDSVPSF